MSFVMIATGATSRSKVRTLSVRPLLLGGAFAALLLMSAGGALGYWVAASPFAQPQAQLQSAGAPAEASHAALPFALEQLGALSGRLFRLESQAAQLSKRVGVPQKNEAPPEQKPGSGGPMLAPRAALPDIAALDTLLARIEQQIARVSDASAERNLEAMRMPTRLPIVGAALVSRFGNRDDPIAHRQAFHAGLDFAAERGTLIHSAAGGTVTFAGFRPDFGWLVEIDHGNGLRTRYAHASKLLVETGTVVSPGERIAMVGSTGRSTGPHLHFEVLRRGEHVDPKQYLAGL
ncbi:MAG: M23 family metallopeptidase [Pseudomonadota bacterium]|nr:M23 family metallopeptidase [Pseudomonadota bacterium]